MNENAQVPWSDCKVAFGCDDEDAVWMASDCGRLSLPPGWSLTETDCSGARCVVIFRVEGLPTKAAGRAVAAALASIVAYDSGYTEKGGETVHAVSSAGAACGAKAVSTGEPFRPLSAYACRKCLRKIARPGSNIAARLAW